MGSQRPEVGSNWTFTSPYLQRCKHLCKMVILPSIFFIFSKFWFSGFKKGEGRVKGQKMVQNEKKLHSISQESYIMRFSFMVLVCEMIISPVVFFHFFKFLIFWVVRWVKGQKVAQNDKNFCHTHKPYIKYCQLWYTSMQV